VPRKDLHSIKKLSFYNPKNISPKSVKTQYLHAFAIFKTYFPSIMALVEREKEGAS